MKMKSFLNNKILSAVILKYGPFKIEILSLYNIITIIKSIKVINHDIFII